MSLSVFHDLVTSAKRPANAAKAINRVVPLPSFLNTLFIVV